jgi:hypothetical protein
MAFNSLKDVSVLGQTKRNPLNQYLPFLDWLVHYRP